MYTENYKTKWSRIGVIIETQPKGLCCPEEGEIHFPLPRAGGRRPNQRVILGMVSLVSKSQRENWRSSSLPRILYPE